MPGPALAIFAGAGDLPRLIAERRRAEGLPYLVVTFADPAPGWVAGHPHQRHRFERLGGLYAALRGAGVGEITFAGGMVRPKLALSAMDWTALATAPRVLGLLGQGDDALLSGLARILEGRGFRLVGAAELMGDLTARPGLLGRHAPRSEDRADAGRAGAILMALGPLDVGQAAVVAGGLCLGIEAIEGTDALLARVAALPPALRRTAPPPAGVLVKLPKPGQDRRLDLPTIGPATVAGAARAGLRGIAIEAGGVNVIDHAATIAAADRAGLFLWAAAAGELAP